MPKKEKKKKHLTYKTIMHIVAIVLIIIIISLIWVHYIKKTNCTNESCFNLNLEKCNRAEFIGGTDMIFKYNILKQSENLCYVDVKLLQGNLNEQDSSDLEGKNMICELPFGAIMLPESNIKNCHGLLKENLQELFITKLHSYIVQNVGQINLQIMPTPED